MSALEIKGLYIKRCINSSVYFLLFTDVTARENNFNKLYVVYVHFTCKSADSVLLCMFLVICSNLITRKCCELNTALILLTL